jgi:hypothetical protein
MPPLAADALRAVPDAPREHPAAADARAQDHAEHDLVAARCAERGLGEGEAVRVVGEPDGDAQRDAQILAERTAIEARGVRVLHEAGATRHAAGHPDPDGRHRGKARLVRQLEGERGEPREDRLVPFVALGGDAAPHELDRYAVVDGHDGPFDLRAAEVDAEDEAVRHAATLRRARPAAAGTAAR